MFTRILYSFIIILAIVSCHKDFESGEKVTTTTFLPEIKEQVQGSILGYVYNDTGQPVEGALVEIYGAVTTTDKFGVFQFENKNLDKLGTFIRVSKDGYMTGSDKIYPAGGRAYSKIKLFSLNTSEKFASPAGGEITMQNGGKLIFPADAIAGPSGESYTGNVFVTSVFLSPLSATLADEMPGDLVAGTLDGINAVLATAGMFGVELRGENKEKLQVKAGKKVKFAIPALAKNKPETVPLWHFDENRGYWIEEGSAVLEQGQYVGEVSHFSFWNVDVPYPLIELCGSVVSANEKPIFGIQLLIEVEGLGTRHGYVDLYGNFCGLVPKNKKLTIIIKRHGCDDVLKTLEVGPFSDFTILNPIVIDDPSLSLEGFVQCEQTPVKNGVVVMQYGQFTYHTITDENGWYSYQFFKCNNEEEITLFAYDKETYKASSPETFTMIPVTTKNIQICNSTCNIEGEIVDKCEYLEMVLTQGSGSVYSFLWSTGDSSGVTQTTLPLEPVTICVTVTDPAIANCNQVFCYEYGGKMRIIVETECNNPMQVFPVGGIAPYTYKWHNGQTSESVVLTSGENYCVTVTDKIGCTAVRCGIFTEVMLEETISNCADHTFDIGSSIFESAMLRRNNSTLMLNSLNNLSIFTTGFNFSISITKGQCSDFRQYSLPQFKGLSIKEVVPVSCQGCVDGFIEIEINSQADCLSCTAGGVRIFSVNDLNNDMSTVNAMRLMPAGEYYVVVEDAVTGCYVAFEKVKIN